MLKKREKNGTAFRPIRLADIVLTIHVKTGKDKTGHHSKDAPDWSIAIDDLVNCHWDLRHDSLDSQTPETIDFLHSILIA
jgi:hypothetical protein